MKCMRSQCNAGRNNSQNPKGFVIPRSEHDEESACRIQRERINVQCLTKSFWRTCLPDVYILSAVRTPIGKFGGSLASMTAADMGVVAAKAAMERAGVHPERIEETIFGNARQAGGGPNVARQISIRSGVPQEVPAYTVNKACASGMKSITLGFQEITMGNLDCMLAGGTESMSRLPYYLDGARWGYRLGNQE